LRFDLREEPAKFGGNRTGHTCQIGLQQRQAAVDRLDEHQWTRHQTQNLFANGTAALNSHELHQEPKGVLVRPAFAAGSTEG